MQKFKNIIITIIICIGLFLAFDFIQYKIYANDFKNEHKHIKTYIPSYLDYITKPNLFNQSITSYEKYYEFLSSKFRKNLVNEKNTKSPILIFGGSYAYGTQLKENENFGYKLFKLTKRDVYNKGIEVCGIQHMYYLIDNPKFYRTIQKTPEYAIFVFIPSHLQRLHNYIFPSPLQTNGAYLHYDLQENKIKLRKDFPLLYKSFLIKKLLAKIDEKNPSITQKNKIKNANLAVKLFIESQKKLKEKYPNIKFVVLRFYQDFDFRETHETPSMWEELEKNGVIVLNSHDLIGRYFTKEETTEDKLHPNTQAWDELIPPLIKKLNL